MRNLSHRTSPSPTRTNYNTTERSRTAEDSPQDAPANPAIADDRNASENPSAALTDQTETQGGSLAGDGETSQPVSSVPATATHPADPLYAWQTLPRDLQWLYELLEQRQVDPLILSESDIVNLTACVPRAPQSGQTEAPREDTASAAYSQLSQIEHSLARTQDDAWRRSFQDHVRNEELQWVRKCEADLAAAPVRQANADFYYRQVHLVQRQRSGYRAQPSSASGPLQRPATASNPTLVLSEKLNLSQDFCDSPGWKDLAKAQDLALLANLVTRALRDTENPNLKTMLRRLVEDMAAKPPLAKRVFVRLLGADESCGDHVSLGLSWAQEEWLAQPVWDGSLNHDLPKVIDIARQVFRRRFIEELAQQKVKDIDKVRRAANLPEHTEDVETLLALLAGLHGPLELGGEKPDAEFTGFRISGVTLEDIEIAKRKVLEHESEHLWNFLATWEPWQSVVLLAHVPDEVAEIKKVLSDPDRPARLEREAAAEMEKANLDIGSVPLKFREDHITRRANQLDHEEERQLWLALTRKAWSNRED